MEQYFHKGQTHRIIDQALDELGVDEAYLQWRLGYEKDERVNFRPDHLSATEWFMICQVLHLDINSIQYGYSRRIHRIRIGTAYEIGHLLLPRTPQVRTMLREAAAARRQSARWEANHYGFRLRWRIRRRRWVALVPTAIRRFWTQVNLRAQLRHEVEGLASERRSMAKIENESETQVGLRTLLGATGRELSELQDNHSPI